LPLANRHSVADTTTATQLTFIRRTFSQCLQQYGSRVHGLGTIGSDHDVRVVFKFDDAAGRPEPGTSSAPDLRRLIEGIAKGMAEDGPGGFCCIKV